MRIADKLFWLLWFLRLFKPEWILSYYVPAFAPLRSVATILLYLLLLLALVAERRRLVADRGFLVFYLAIVVSTIFAENTGRSMPILRGMTDSLVFFALSAHHIRDERSLDRLLGLYLGAFVFYGLIGIANRGLVPFHVLLNNEDAFGPFMAMGVPLMFFAREAGKYRRLFLLATVVCLVGVFASFARGAFLSLCAAVFYIWLRHPQKLRLAAQGIVLGILGLAIGSTWLRSTGYWAEIATIAASVKSDSHAGEDRYLLAKKALVMFTIHPVLGAGPMNYGHMYPKVLTLADVQERDTTAEKLYGRVPHNIYAQILAELGTVGTIAFVVMIGGFVRSNLAVSRAGAADCGGQAGRHGAYAKGVLGALLVFAVNGVVYDILYYHWLQDVLIMNCSLGQHSAAASPHPAESHGSEGERQWPTPGAG